MTSGSPKLCCLTTPPVEVDVSYNTMKVRTKTEQKLGACSTPFKQGVNHRPRALALALALAVQPQGSSALPTVQPHLQPRDQVRSRHLQ